MVGLWGRGSAACVCAVAVAVGCAGPGAGRVSAEARGKMLTLDNGILWVRYDTETGTFTAARGDLRFIAEGRLGAPGREAAPDVRFADARDALGKGKSIEATWADGHRTRMTLYDSLPLLCVKGSFRNPTEQPKTLEQIAPLSATLDAGAPVSALRGLGPEGLFGLGRRTCFCFAAAANPTTRAGVISGWLTHHRGSGVVALNVDGGTLTFGARAEYGRLLVPPGTTAEGETLAIGYFDDALEGLEAYGEARGKANEVSLPARAPSGYCTWYHAGALNQARAAELAAFCGKHLNQFGFEFIQIDDGWQVGKRDFTTHRPRGAYSNGMKLMAGKITSQGLTAGIWYIPFGWDKNCPSLRDHAEWFVKRRDVVALVNWREGQLLDIELDVARLGLPASPETRYVGFDYWEGLFVPPFAEKRTFRLRPSSCRVIALSRLAARPQLVSTSRHVTQGAIDVTQVGWDGKESPKATVSVRTPALPPPPPPPDVHISDLKPIKATVGWGGPAKPNRSIGGRPLSIAGKRYKKGMGVHAASELAYALEPGYHRFVAVVGIDDEERGDPRASVVFEVYVDEKRIARSPVMRPAAGWFIDTTIPAGSKRLRLVATDAGDGIACDHADWANAGFIRGK